jgi:hypothetical protein
VSETDQENPPDIARYPMLSSLICPMRLPLLIELSHPARPTACISGPLLFIRTVAGKKSLAQFALFACFAVALLLQRQHQQYVHSP